MLSASTNEITKTETDGEEDKYKDRNPFKSKTKEKVIDKDVEIKELTKKVFDMDKHRQ